MTLSDLRLNRRFVVKDCPSLKGKLVAKSECAATVVYDHKPYDRYAISLNTEIRGSK